MKRHFNISIYLLFTVSSLISCVEKYEPKTTVFEPVLVVESTITNEYKKQQVKLSRAIPLDSVIPDSEKNALVKIISSNGNTYNFTETTAGLYESNQAFQAESNVEYQLYIQTETGEEYESAKEVMTPIAPISVYAERETIKGNLGVQVYVDSQENPDAKYFRYEFEETYKFVTPYVVNTEVELWNLQLDPLEYQFHFTPSTYQEILHKHICYPNSKNKKIILGNTLVNVQPKIVHLPISFVDFDDYKIAERYSINVKQYVLNVNSYSFYKKIRDLSSNQQLLSSMQPGFVNGNLKALNSDYKIVGYFNVNSFSQKRIYFDYADFGFPKPLFPFECDVSKYLDYRDNFVNPNIDGDINERSEIYEKLNYYYPPYELLNYYTVWTSNEPNYLIKIVNPGCSNCSNYYPATRPDFWQD